jgi:hypothetical protein
VPAFGQNDADLPLEVLSVDGVTLKGLVPRLRLVGVEQVTIRFAAESRPWQAVFDLEQAELHSAEQALVTLRLLSVEEHGEGRIAKRVGVHAAGMLTATMCRNAVRGNQYSVRVDDVSETGFQFTTELDIVRGDEFGVTFEAGGRRLHLEGKAMTVSPGPYGRHVVGARITGTGPGDLRTLGEIVGS